MPSVKYTNKQGLIQKGGSGIDLSGGTLYSKVNVIALTDAAAASAIRDAITVSESGSWFTVPALTTGTQTITLPALAADVIGCTYKFVTIATTGQIMNVLGADSDLIMAVIPDGAGNNTAISQGYDSVGFTAAAVLGSSFTVTCISTTAGVGWFCHDVVDGLAANVGCLVVT